MEADWIATLREKIAESNQANVARDLEIGEGTLSQVLAGKYPAKTTAIERTVRGKYMGLELQCPAAGMMTPAYLCVRHQRIPFGPGNPLRTRFMEACPECQYKL